MTVVKGDVIKKSEVISKFNSEVVDFAYASIGWHSGSYPTGQGFPTNQLGSNSKVYLTAIDSNVPTASVLISALTEATRKLTKIRNFRYQRYFKTNDSYALQYDQTALAVFADTLAEPNWLSDWGSGRTSTGRNSVTGTGVSNPFQTVSASAPSTLAKGQIVKAEDVNTFITTLKNTWNSLKNNTLTVANYFCYTYSQWADNRGRR